MNDKEKRKSDDKPGYVESDYLSRPYVTTRFKRPTERPSGQLHCLYCLVLLRMGFTEPTLLPR